MATEKQRAANRANALKSTGPRSKKGKMRSRTNAMTHGLTAKQVLAPGETTEQLDELLEGLIAEFAPRTTFEHEQVYHLAVLSLRRRRPAKADAALHRMLMAGPFFEETVNATTDEEFEVLERVCRRVQEITGQPDLSYAVERHSAGGDQNKGIPRRVEMLTIYSRYEAHITNEMIKTVRLILFLQERRVAA